MFDWLKKWGISIGAALAFTGIGAVAHMSASDVKSAACSADVKSPAPAPSPAEKAK